MKSREGVLPFRIVATDDDEVTARAGLPLVVETMRTYWTPWLGAKMAVLESKKLESRAAGQDIALLPL